MNMTVGNKAAGGRHRDRLFWYAAERPGGATTWDGSHSQTHCPPTLFLVLQLPPPLLPRSSESPLPSLLSHSHHTWPTIWAGAAALMLEVSHSLSRMKDVGMVGEAGRKLTAVRRGA